MPTVTNFELILLTSAADVDAIESGDGSVAENAADLLGTYGSAGAPISAQQFNAFVTDGDDDGLIREDGEGGSGIDTLTVENGGSFFNFELDSTIGYMGTVTYTDGTSEPAALGVIQDNAGNVWLLPVSNASDFNTKQIESVTLSSVALDNGTAFSPASSSEQGFVCFAPQTRILTPDGPRAIETLQPGDLIETMDHGPQPLMWRVERTLDFEKGAPIAQKPIEIKPGALGAGLPKRSLLVSPQHRILLTHDRQDVLAPAKALLSFAGIRRCEGKRRVTYHALLFEEHQVIFAEGAAVESLYPGPQAMIVLSPLQRLQVLAMVPRLLNDPQAGYGPYARSVVKPKEVRSFASLKGRGRLPEWVKCDQSVDISAMH